MSKYTKTEQLNILKQVLQLEAGIAADTAELKSLNKAKFKEPAPSAPKLQKVDMYSHQITADYSKLPSVEMIIKPSYNTWVEFAAANRQLAPIRHMFRFTAAGPILIFIGIIFAASTAPIFGSLLVLSGMMIFILGAGQKSALKSDYAAAMQQIDDINRKRVEWLHRRPDYLQAKQYADAVAIQQNQQLYAQRLQQQAQYDEAYSIALAEYQTKTLPAYQQRASEWEATHQLMLTAVTNDLQECKTELSQLYDTTQFIPFHVRDPKKLYWIYRDMATSEHDIERAIDLLNANLQLAATQDITAAVTNLNEDMKYGMSVTYEELKHHQRSLQDIQSELRSTRKHIDIGIGINAVQSHNANKHIKHIDEQTQQMFKAWLTRRV